MNRLKQLAYRIPFVGALYGRLTDSAFPGSQAYWEKRYAAGGNSGAGSYGRLAEFKAEAFNAFVVENDVASVIEFGCGDGNQVSLAKYAAYIGLDVSRTVIDQCARRFADDASKSFITLRAG